MAPVGDNVCYQLSWKGHKGALNPTVRALEPAERVSAGQALEGGRMASEQDRRASEEAGRYSKRASERNGKASKAAWRGMGGPQ